MKIFVRINIVAYFIIVIYLAFFLFVTTLKSEEEINYSVAPILYEKNDNLLAFFPFRSDKINLSETDDYAFAFDKLIFLKDNILYNKTFNNIEKNIDKDVSFFNVQEKSKVFFEKNGQYYYKDDKQKILIDEIVDRECNYFSNYNNDIFVKQISNKLYISNKKLNYVQLGMQNTSFIMFEGEGVIYCEEVNDRCEIYKGFVDRNPIKLFEVKNIKNLYYNTNSSRMLFQDEQGDYYIYYNEKKYRVANNITAGACNNNIKDIDYIRCLLNNKANRYIFWDERFDNVINLDIKILLGYNSNINSILYYDNKDELIFFHVDDNGEYYENILSNKLRISDEDDFYISDDGERIFVTGETLQLVNCNGDINTITDDYYKYYTSKQLKSIAYQKNNNLYYYNEYGNELICKNPVIADINEFGNVIVVKNDEDNLYIKQEDNKCKIIDENVKDFINYEGEIIYYRKNNNELYCFQLYNNAIIKIDDNVERIEKY